MREVSPIAGALSGLCPQCKSKTLFAGWVRFANRCRACGLTVDGAVAPPWWVHLIWLPVGVALTIFGLRAGKALLLTQEYIHRAREGRIVE